MNDDDENDAAIEANGPSKQGVHHPWLSVHLFIVFHILRPDPIHYNNSIFTLTRAVILIHTHIYRSYSLQISNDMVTEQMIYRGSSYVSSLIPMHKYVFRSNASIRIPFHF